LDIVVCGKVIPASSVTIEIDPDTKRMKRKGVTHELDPAAASAVEEGLRLTEKHGGTVTLITMGISDVTIGTTITNPNVDYATVARGFGVHGEGPITDPKDLAPALKRAIAVVKRGEPALIDVVTDPR